MHTSVYQKVVAFDFMFPPLPLLLENPKYFTAREKEINEDFRFDLQV